MCISTPNTTEDKPNLLSTQRRLERVDPGYLVLLIQRREDEGRKMANNSFRITAILDWICRWPTTPLKQAFIKSGQDFRLAGSRYSRAASTGSQNSGSTAGTRKERSLKNSTI